jgi:hypothetical protein
MVYIRAQNKLKTCVQIINYATNTTNNGYANAKQAKGPFIGKATLKGNATNATFNGFNGNPRQVHIHSNCGIPRPRAGSHHSGLFIQGGIPR